MKIITCIKQVPASSNVKINPETGTLIREGNNTKMNPFDLYALEVALRIKEQTGCTINAITMGPPSATAVLDEALWMGCDDGYLLTDRKFAGADVVSTSYTLSQGIQCMGSFDLIICGKQTTDGDTAQVGAELANFLEIPYVYYVDKILEVKENSIIVRKNSEKTYEILEVLYPCLITVDNCCVTPRLPSYRRSVMFKEHKNHFLTFNDLPDQDENEYGLLGSPTQVERMFNPTKNENKVLFEGTDDELALELANILKKGKYL